MKKLILLVTLIFVGVTINAQSEEEMKAWQAYMTPSESHLFLQKMEGKWKTESKHWMDPNSEPIFAVGESINEMIMGGRYQRSTFKGDFMGAPFQGESITGYDNATKEYFTTWIDNMGTGLMVTKGTFNPDTRQLELKGKMVDPMTGKPVPVREVTTIETTDKYFFEMFMTYEGKEMKVMEITYSRIEE